MFIKFDEIIKEVDLINNSFQWEKGFNDFWFRLNQQTIDEESKTQVLTDLLYFYTRYLEFASSILHRNTNQDLMFILSADYVQILNLELNKLPNLNIDVSPGLESICNYMLVMAETDLLSYFISFYTLNKLIFRKEQFKELVVKNEGLTNFFNLMDKSFYTLNRVGKLVGDVKASELNRILKNNYTLCETIDYWFNEIIIKYNKKMVPEKPQLIKR
ncbi:hypothetical protein [Priestia flexa]|uniref:hypothetical protein n=1 Tax=Priestia flexa TaxID=86664 RepID=UPI00077CAEAD|nr:hypothetical protein [Priestia flexa]MED4590509.1 hypothetical protein [Priestia flexa]